MKKIFTLTLLFAIMGTGVMKAANEIYAFFNSDGTRMTICYDGNREKKNGITDWWDLYTYASKRQNVTRIIIDYTMENARPTDMEKWFANFPNLTYIQEIWNINTSEVTSMHMLFNNSPKLTFNSTDLQVWNVSKVKYFSSMFKECNAFTGYDLSNWDASSAESMLSMFEGCASLKWIHLPKNTGNVKDFSSMFAFCEALESVGAERLDTRSATSFYAMFIMCGKLKEVDVSKWNTENAEDMQAMFYGCESLTKLDVDSFKTAKVQDFSEMFDGCSGIKMLDLRSFDFASAKKIKDMFNGCSSLQKIYCNKDLAIVPQLMKLTGNTRNLFSGCTSLTTDNGTVYDESKISLDYAHLDGGVADPGYFTMDRKLYYVYDNAETTTFFFDEKMKERDGTECRGTAILPPAVNATNAVLDESVDYAYPSSTKNLFGNLKAITYIPTLKYLHTDNVTDMSGMFSGCAKLQMVDIRTFRFDKVENVSNMFKDCKKLRQILCAENWNEYAISSAEDIFANCQSIVGSHSTPFDAAQTGIEYARPDNAPAEPGYFWKDEQDIKNVQSDKGQSTKVLRDGMLLIERGGKIFNAQGVEME